MKKSRFVKGAKVALIASVAVASSAFGADPITMPTADYTNINAAAVLGFGIVITVALLMKAKSFLKG